MTQLKSCMWKFFSDLVSDCLPVPWNSPSSFKLKYVASGVSPPLFVSYWPQVYWGIKAARDLRPPRHASSDGLADAALSKHKEVGMDEQWVKSPKGELAANCNYSCTSLKAIFWLNIVLSSANHENSLLWVNVKKDETHSHCITMQNLAMVRYNKFSM